MEGELARIVGGGNSGKGIMFYFTKHSQTQSYHSPTNTISNTHRTAKRSAPRRNKTPVAHDRDGTRLVNPAHSLDQAKQIDLRLPPHRRVVPKAVLFPDRWERECYCESVLRGGNERRCVLHKGPL